MRILIFTTHEATFQFDRKAVIECLEHRKSNYEIRELDTLIDVLDVLSNQPEHTILSSAEHQYFGFIALDLIKLNEGVAICKKCGKRYRSNLLRPFKVGPDDTSVEVASAKKGGLKSLFRKKPKLPGLYGGKGYKCPEDHELIFMITWTT